MSTVKVEHQHPAGLLQPLPVPEWKWEVISMDFITGLPMTWRQHDSIMVVVDKLTKAAHFIPVKSTYETGDIAKIFMKEIFKLHGLPKAIVSDRDVKFTSNFWKGLFVLGLLILPCPNLVICLNREACLNRESIQSIYSH